MATATRTIQVEIKRQSTPILSSLQVDLIALMIALFAMRTVRSFYRNR